jgi:two-component system, chemotaxis family, chemotaxis protein CheY
MKNVLVVEDSKAIRSMIRVSLEEAGGFFAVEAGNGFEALKTLPTLRFDLIITDINMPDINGLELIGYVKSNPTYRDIPLIIVSTEKSEEDKKRGITLGAAGYVVKPFRKEELMSMVTKVLESASRDAR